MMVESNFEVNGQTVTLDVPDSTTLLGALRDQIGLTGTKFNCEQGECGACTVLLDGQPVNSCLVLAASVDGHEIVTIEGLGACSRGIRVQAAFLDCDAAQCGYCTPGMVVSASALLTRSPHPSRAEVEESIAGNYCRCTGYESIFQAIERSAEIGERS